MVLGKLGSPLKRMELDHSLTPYTNINLTRIQDVSARPETPRRKHWGSSLTLVLAIMVFGSDTKSTDKTTQKQTFFKKWDYKLKSVSTAKESTTK